jgi:hypothetical protein
LPLTPKERLGLQNSGQVLRATIEAVEGRLAQGEAGDAQRSVLEPKGRVIPRAAWQKK